jgi:hypothetical protein
MFSISSIFKKLTAVKNIANHVKYHNKSYLYAIIISQIHCECTKNHIIKKIIIEAQKEANK